MCDRARIRTWDRLLRRQVLYPAELRDQFYRAKIEKMLDLINIFHFKCKFDLN